MTLTLNINTNDVIINVNSSDSDNVILKRKPSKVKNDRNELDSISFLVTEKDIEDACCDHRTDGHFDVSHDPDIPGLFRCNKCHEFIDLYTKYDPALVKKVIDFLWATFQALKTNNNDGTLSKEAIYTMATSLLALKTCMPNMVKVINDRTKKNIERWKKENLEQWKGSFPWGTPPPNKNPRTPFPFENPLYTPPPPPNKNPKTPPPDPFKDPDTSSMYPFKDPDTSSMYPFRTYTTPPPTPPNAPYYPPPPFTNQESTDDATTHKGKDEKKPPTKPKK